MKIIIEISPELYEYAMNDTYTSIDELDAIIAIKNGTVVEEGEEHR